jgi:hypothetical protein
MFRHSYLTLRKSELGRKGKRNASSSSFPNRARFEVPHDSGLPLLGQVERTNRHMRHAELVKPTKAERKTYLRKRKEYYWATHEAYLKRKRDGYRRRKAEKKKAAKGLAQRLSVRGHSLDRK